MRKIKLTAEDRAFAAEIAAANARDNAERAYRAYIARVEAVEKATGLYLSDVNVDRENAAEFADGSLDFWQVMLSSAQAAVVSRCEDAGRDPNEFSF